jgi:hypothetical protein
MTTQRSTTTPRRSRVAAFAAFTLSLAGCVPRTTDVSGSPDANARPDAGADGDGGPRCVPGGTTALEPVTVACEQATPARLVVDGDHVYWTVQGGGPIVMRAPLAGGAPETLVYDSAAAVGLAVDATFVYYTQPSLGRIMRVPRGGGLPVALATGLDWPLFLALDREPDGASLCWAGGQKDGTIMKLALVDGAKPVTLIDGQSRPRAVAVQDGFVYWTDFADGTILRTPDRLDASADGGVRTATRLAAGLKGPSDLALAGGFAYVPDQAGHVARVPLGGGALETIADVAGIPFGVATDGQSVYWSTLGDGGIFRTPVGGGPIDTLADAQADPHFVALSSIAVYWSTWGRGGAIRKIAK